MPRATPLLLLMSLALAPALTANAGSPPAFLGAWGTAGSGPGQFQHPYDVSVGPDGRVYVLDTENLRVEYFTGDGAFVGVWPLEMLPGTYSPEKLAVGPSGDVYVVSRYSEFYSRGDVIQRYSAAGVALGSSLLPENYASETTIYTNFDVATTSSGDVLAAYSYDDARFPPSKHYQSYVAHFSASLSLLNWWGGDAGTAPGQIGSRLTGIAVDAAGHILLSDGLGSRIQVFSIDGMFLSQWGVKGSAPGQISTPWSIDIGPTGHVYLSDVGLQRVTEFDAGGSFVSAWGSSGSGPAQFSNPLEVVTTLSDSRAF